MVAIALGSKAILAHTSQLRGSGVVLVFVAAILPPAVLGNQPRESEDTTNKAKLDANCMDEILLRISGKKGKTLTPL